MPAPNAVGHRIVHGGPNLRQHGLIGISLGETRNRSAVDPISDALSCCPGRVLASQEDEQIARHTRDLVS